jgi:hypothetical protein
MDRELVLAILVTLLCGSVLTAAGWYPVSPPQTSSAILVEQRAWRRIWLPFGPALVLFAALCGWAFVEPADAERVPTGMLWGLAPCAVVAVRTAWRAWRSLAVAHQQQAIATVGLLRPRIVLSPHLANGLDADALRAALAHERVHASHRDPLRLWLAQLATDLLWPWPSARKRFRCWQEALEQARDEEARRNGANGPDLAAAILASIRLGRRAAFASAATLTGDEAVLAERITRLMRPLDHEQPMETRVARLAALGVAAGLALCLGVEFGEIAVRALLAFL